MRDHLFNNQPVSFYYNYSYKIQMIQNRTPQRHNQYNQHNDREDDSFQSFYSLDNSKSNFTFEQIPQPTQTKLTSNKIVNMLGIKQSSALHSNQFSQNELNQSMHTIVLQEQVNRNQVLSEEEIGMKLHDISGIDHKEINELDCSMCLQKEIDCLSLPNQMSPEKMDQLNNKMDRLKQDQSLLMRQIEVFKGLMKVTKQNNQELVKQVMQANYFIKKKCGHQPTIPFGMPQDRSLSENQSVKNEKTLKQSKNSNNLPKVGFKHYDIKPATNRSASEQQMNLLYKTATFEGKITLINVVENQYKIQVTYDRSAVIVEVINYSRGVTNFIYAAKFNEETEDNSQRISQKLVFPLHRYMNKKFTLSLNILLLFFAQNLPKQEQNLVKIEQIRTVSVPLPLNYFVEARFCNVLAHQKEVLLSKMKPKMFTYEIDIKYRADTQSYKRLKELAWVKNQWFTLKGSNRIIYMQLSQIEEKENTEKGVVFKVAIKDKDAQQAVDLIEFLCFMLAL